MLLILKHLNFTLRYFMHPWRNKFDNYKYSAFSISTNRAAPLNFKHLIGQMKPVHLCPDVFENASCFIHFGLAFTLRRYFWSLKKKCLMNAFQSGSFWKRRFAVIGRKRSFSKTLESQRRLTTHQSMCLDLWVSREGNLLICFRSSKITGFSCG